MVAIVTGTGLGLERSSGWVLGSRGQLGDPNFNRYGENVFVNAATGNLMINRTDEILIGQGPDDVVGRSYNSLGTGTDDNGDNWQLSASRKVTNLTGTVNTSGSTVTRIDWDGSDELYTYDTASGKYICKGGAGAYDTLSFASNTWTWTDGNSRIVETYDNTHSGRITASTDTDGNALTYTYDGTSGLLTRVTVTDTSGTQEHTDFSYSGNNLTQVVTTLSTGATLTRVRYTYDGSNRLSTVTTDLSPNDNSITDGKTVVTTYTYDSTSKRVASISQTGGALLQIAYDGSNRVHTLTQTIASGDTRVTTLNYYTGYTEIVDGQNQTTRLTYDASGQLTQVNLPAAQTGATPQIIHYVYNSNGDVLTATDASGNVITYTYDSSGNLTQSQDQAGNTVQYTYGSNNQLLTETQYPAGTTAGTTLTAYDDSQVAANIGDAITFDPRINDTDSGSYSLSITDVSAPTHGTATIVNGGTQILYTRTSAGTDSFTYTVSDGHGAVATATITVADYVGSSNSAPYASDDYPDDGGTGHTLIFDPRANDSDPEGDRLTITAVSTPTKGTATIVNGGTAISYYRTSTGSDSFTYTISDGHGNTSTATAHVADTTPPPSNSAPTATADGGLSLMSVPTTLDPRYNDTDPDNDVLTITAVGTPTHGTVSIANGGTAITYTRTSTGVDTFSYTISDGHGHTATANITMIAGTSANLAPTARNDSIAAAGIGTSMTFDPRINDDDANVDPLTITAVSTPSHGTATILNGTAINYVRSSSGADSFTYTISDGQGHTATATVTVTDPSTGTNQAPGTADDNIVVNAVGDNATFDPRMNDADFETDLLTIQSVSTPSHGTATVINGGRAISYTRTSAGSDSFTYTITDGYGHFTTATVHVTSAAGDGGSGTGGGSGTPTTLVTRYAYDSHNHLRFVVSPKGEVTEFQYNSYGQQTATLSYTGEYFDVGTLSSDATTWAATIASAVHAISDLSTVHLTKTEYDFRGNVTNVTSYTAVTTDGTYGFVGSASQPYTVVTYSYDQFGNLLSRHTAGVANSEVFVADGLGRITSSVDLNNTTTTVAFTDGSNQSVVTLANGLVKTSTYNDAGELITYTESGTGIATATSSYKYDKDGRLRMVTDPLGNNSYIIYDNVGRKVADIAADGSMVEYGYDASNRLVNTIAYATKVGSSGLTSLTTAGGNVDISTIRPSSNASDVWGWRIYDTANRLIETIDSDGDATVFGYDGTSNLISTTSYANAIGSTTLATFKTTIPTTLQLPTADSNRDQVSRNFYDEDGRLVGVLNGEGYLSEVIYDAAGQKAETVAFATAVASSTLRASGTFAQLLTAVGTSSQDRHERYFYDDRGFLRYTLDATLCPTEYVYDNAGHVLETIAYAGSINSTTTYSLSYVQSQITSTGLSSNADNRTSWAVYDPNSGNLIYSIDANGDVVKYTYDAMGEIIKQIAYATTRTTTSSPDLSTMDSWATTHASDTGNRTSRFVYDAEGRVVYSVDAESYVTQYQYDADGHVTLQIRFADRYTVTDGVTQSSLATLIGTIPASAAQTSYSYDIDGRLSSRTDGYGSSEATTTQYTYNALGEVTDTKTAYSTANEETTHYTYDAAGRMVTTTQGYGTADAATTTYTYDAFGNVFSITDPRGNASYTIYDKLDRLIWQIDADGYATQTQYTIGNAVSSVTHYANQATGTFTPGTAPSVTPNSSKDETTSFTRDNLDRITRVTDAEGYHEDYTLNAFGDRISVTNKLGGVTTNVFDHRGLLISETLPMSSINPDGTTEATSVTNTFQYDAFGNRTQMVEASGLTEQRTTTYAYDKLNRLVTTTHGVVGYVYSDLVTTGTVTPQETVQYDSRGNVIETTAAGAQTFFYYDHLGRKIEEVNAAGVLSQWDYDKNGNVTALRVYDTAITLPGSAGGTPPSPAGGSGYRQTLYAYDALNRLKTTTVANLETGYYNTTSSIYAVSQGNVVLTNYYDGNGNVVCQTDGDGNSVWFYYDNNNRKIAQVDQQLYLTTYALDADGNVTTETRYATALGSAPSVPPSSTVPTPSTSSDDRITVFTYDRNGRRLTEKRTGVTAWTVNTSTGALTAASTNATVTYTYNGLGEVTRKTEATGEYTNYTYDSTGRQTTVQGSSFTDYNNSSVQKTTNQYYDGLNNLTRTVQVGDGTNPNRVTTYEYTDGGRLYRMTDASGFQRTYQYNINGYLTKESYSRVKSDGSSVVEANVTTYDVLGRAVTQTVATFNGTSWTAGDTTGIQYNAYGEVVARGLNGMSQETNSYDASGRITRSTANDGTVKLYLYDSNGNQTLTITSDGNALPSGSSWSTLTVDQAIALLTNNGANAIGAVAISGLVVTFTAFDKRGQATSTIEPLRQLSSNGSGGFNTAQIVHSKTYNAFGEVASQTDARGNVTNFTYNTEGKIILTQYPTVSYTAENGGISSAHPTQTNYYDLSGRLVGVRDANNNLSTRLLLSGTGYNGSDVSELKEFHPDGGIVTNAYDVFGDLRKNTNEVGKVETYNYDAMDRLTSQVHQTRASGEVGNNTGSAITLTDYFAYDGLGQRIQHWNSFYGSSYKDKTDYDSQGRVAQVIAIGGDTTSYSYAWDGSLVTTGLGTFGGWTKTTTNSSGISATESDDYFGRMLKKVDFGAHEFDYSFDSAGRMISYVNPANTTIYHTNSYFNTGLMASASFLANRIIYGGYHYDTNYTTTYKYDADGNRTYEGYYAVGSSDDPIYVPNSTRIDEATTTWDAMNRMVTYTDVGGSTVPLSISWEYDLNNNVRHMYATYDGWSNTGTDNGSHIQDYWYKYDSMNRFTLTEGVFSGTRGSGTIGRGSTGKDITYDAAGNRATATDSNNNTETFLYTSDGYLGQVKISGTVRANYYRDALGRVTSLIEYTLDPFHPTAYSRAVTYNNKSQVTQDIVVVQNSDTSNTTTTTTYDYFADTNSDGVYGDTGDQYMGGAVTHQHATVSSHPTNDTVNSFVWWDQLLLNVTHYTPNVSQPGTVYTSTYAYDGRGQLQSVNIQDGRPRLVSFINNDAGQIILRYEQDNNNNQGDPKESHYYFNNEGLGVISNNGPGSDVDYAYSISHRNAGGSGAFAYGATNGTQFADADASYDPINGYTVQSTASQYTVVEGDTLAGIAQQLWGDASFWYLIADANGLNGSETLVAGQSLIIPDKIHNAHNTSSTFNVFDPNTLMGNTSPTAPKPQKHHGGGCGVIGEVILVVIAIVVTILMPYLFPATFAAMGPILGGAVAAAAGSIVSQGVGLATGIQSKFNWGAVAIAAISAGVMGGIGPDTFSSLGEIGGAVARGVVANMATQGIELATGLEHKFDWTSVAMAGVAAGVSAEVGGAINYKPGMPLSDLNNDLLGGVAGMAGGIASAATRSLITGTDFGDNLMAELPNTIGSTIGNMIAGRIPDDGNTNLPKGGMLNGSADNTGKTAGNNGYQIQPVPINADEVINSGMQLINEIPTIDVPRDVADHVAMGDTYDAATDTWHDANGVQSVLVEAPATDTTGAYNAHMVPYAEGIRLAKGKPGTVTVLSFGAYSQDVRGGAQIVLKYHGSRKDLQWIQTYRDWSNAGHGNPIVDNGLSDPGSQFYYSSEKLKDPLVSGDGYFIFRDAPATPEANDTWMAETSLVRLDADGHYHEVVTYSWGYQRSNNSVTLIQPKVVQPSDAQQAAIKSAK